MGYSTDFSGALYFTKELKASEITKLGSFLGADCREHPEWGQSDLTYIDLKFLNDFSGLEWNGREKTCELIEKINLIIKEMKKFFPDFGLSGSMLAQGEDIEDRWNLVVENNIAKRVDILMVGDKIECPHCGEYFYLETK